MLLSMCLEDKVLNLPILLCLVDTCTILYTCNFVIVGIGFDHRGGRRSAVQIGRLVPHRRGRLPVTELRGSGRVELRIDAPTRRRGPAERRRRPAGGVRFDWVG